MRVAARHRRVGNTTRRIVLVVVAAVAFVFVANFARVGLDATKTLLEHDSIAETYAASDTYRCVQSKIDHRVPAGTAIAVRSPDPLWLERAREGSYSRYDVTTEARAEYVVTVVPRGDPCEQVDVLVSRTR